jgi:hypothetical protein
MSNTALFGLIKELQRPDAKYYKLALAREISNHLFLKSTLGISSGELTEQDMTLILGRFQLVLQTLNQPPLPPPSMTQPLPAGPEAYAPKAHRESLRTVERLASEGT